MRVAASPRVLPARHRAPEGEGPPQGEQTVAGSRLGRMSVPAFFLVLVGGALVLTAATEALLAAGYENAAVMVMLASLGSAAVLAVVRGRW